MFSFLICGWIAYSIYFSVKRGFKLETIMFAGYVISGIAAIFFARLFWRVFSLYVPYSSVINEKPLYFYSKVNVFDVEESFYRIVTFMIFYFLFCLLMRFVEVFIKKLQFSETPTNLKVVTGVLGFMTGTFSLYLIFSALAMVPLSGLQNTLTHSFLVNGLIKGPFGWIFNQLWL
ncbi:CvpA family protein [Xylocopilactobacillus apicola]|uniref:Colicin V production protein n=1 Tax=Xylocopilactobacillus apicola TaxID=2932184 RepID=A0AAU9D4W3_9LACO|nr:CvpA family protein [Xylocopilactobacillus apicola]BDR58809.1 hypothetical protein XA3_12500 [Xylocopilactobacillus apicola]